MNRRRTLIPVALAGSVGIALIPTLAQAASSVRATTRPSVTDSFSSAVAAGAIKYDAPASKSVYSRSAGSASTPNPDLAVGFMAVQSGAFGVAVGGAVTGVTSGSAYVTVDCGSDGTGGLLNAPVDPTTGAFTTTCEYSTLGQSHEISASATDKEGDLATNSVSGLQTAGATFGSSGQWRILDTRKGIGAAAGAVAPGATLKFKVTGQGSNASEEIPTGVTAVALNVTAVSPTQNGFLSVYGNENQSGTQLAAPGTSNINFLTGQNVANMVIVPVGKDGVVNFLNSSKGSTQIVADVAGFYTPNAQQMTNTDFSGYTPIAPARVVDTRKGTGTGKVAKIPANGTITVQMSGVDGIGANATSVALNITAVGGTRNGVISAYMGNPGSAVPTLSSVNYSAGQTASNMAIVSTSIVGSASIPLGRVSFHNNSSGAVDLVVDAVGYYGTDAPTVDGTSAYVPLQSPARVLDTRKDDDPLSSGTPIDMPGTALSSDTAAVLNATVVAPTGNGYFSIYPYNPNDPSALPTTSNLNYLAGQTVPSLVIASPGTVLNPETSTYDFSLYFGGKGKTQLVLDEFGYFANK